MNMKARSYRNISSNQFACCIEYKACTCTLTFILFYRHTAKTANINVKNVPVENMVLRTIYNDY